MNKAAPYNNEEHMERVIDWWNTKYPDGTPKVPEPMHILELYKSYLKFYKLEPWSPGYVDANQFAKMLVKAKIADMGNGWWVRVPDWEPMEYEIQRARVY